MSEIKINTGRTNTQTHRAVLQPEQIKQILADRVCEAAAVSRDADETSVSVQLSSRMGNYGSEYEAIVTVTVDYEKKTGAGALMSVNQPSATTRVSELIGAQLDYWVARASGIGVEMRGAEAVVERIRLGILDGEGDEPETLRGVYRPSTDWCVGGPIIAREGICISPHYHGKTWGAWITASCYESNDPDATGDTPLLAAMRAYVLSKFGSEVSV